MAHGAVATAICGRCHDKAISCFSAVAGLDGDAAVCMVEPLDKADWSCAQGSSASAQVELSNAGLIDQNKVDNAHTEIHLLAKETRPKGFSRQVFELVLREYGGRKLKVIIASRTGEGECPYDHVDTWVVSQAF